jgi:photosystem II stability/assembly factor-like uncharacterized protein
MKRFPLFIPALTIALFLQGCLGNGGSPASVPANVTVVTGDSSATVSWDMLPGVNYWVYKAAGTNVTPENCISQPECYTTVNAVSPAVIGGLTNGTTYSFAVNGRSGGASGGPASASISVVPRLAGAVWSSGSQLGTNDLRGVAYGAATTTLLVNTYVAAGANGALFSSPNGTTWTALTNPLPTANFNAVAYGGGKFVVAGAGGVLLLSSDAVTWTQKTSPTTNDLYAVTGNSGGGFVAVGANGTILSSSDGASWVTVLSGTTNNLYGAMYGNGRYVVVGAGGTLLTSTDGVNWQTIAALTSQDLKGAAYGASTLYNVNTYVAVGAGGVLETSTDGVTWKLQAPIPSLMLNAVAYGHQFISVDNNGDIFTSIDGISWQLQSFVTSLPIYAITHSLYTYSAVGGSGGNFYSM